MTAIKSILDHRSSLAALTVLAALLAAAVLALAPARAVPPDDLELILSIAGESDNVVPPGSSITVNAHLVYPGSDAIFSSSEAAVRISDRNLEWDGSGGSTRLALDDADHAYGSQKGEWFPPGLCSYAGFGAEVALGRSTLVVSAPNCDAVYVFDVRTRELLGTLRASDQDGAEPIGFGSALAVWDSEVGTSTIFVGSPNDQVPAVSAGVDCRGGGSDVCQVGRVFIYTMTRTLVNNDPNDVTASFIGPRVLTPSKKSGVVDSNDPQVNRGARFGASLAVAGSAAQLVVGAPGMHLSGGAIVFEKPGRGWNFPTPWDGDGTTVKLTPFSVSDDRPSLLDGDGGNSVDDIGDRSGSTALAQTYDGAQVGASVSINDDGSWIVLGAPYKQWELDGSQHVSSVQVGTPLLRGPSTPVEEKRRITDDSARYVGEVLVFGRPGATWNSVPAGNNPPGSAKMEDDDLRNIGRPTTILKAHDALTAGVPFDEELLGLKVAVSAGEAYIIASAPQTPGSQLRQNAAGSGPLHEPLSTGRVYAWRKPSSDWWDDAETTRLASTVGGGSFSNETVPVDHTSSAIIAPPVSAATRGGQFGSGALQFNAEDPSNNGVRNYASDNFFIGQSNLHDPNDVDGSDFQGRGWVVKIAASTIENAPRGMGDTPKSVPTTISDVKEVPLPDPIDNGFFGAAAAYILDPPSGVFTTPDRNTALVVAQPQYNPVFGRTEVGPGRVWLFRDSQVGTDAMNMPTPPMLIDYGKTQTNPPTDRPNNCVITGGADGNRNTVEDNVVRCSLALANADAMITEGEIEVPLGLSEDTFTISGSVKVNGATLTDTLEVRIGEVDELTEINFGVGSDAAGNSLPTTLTKSGPRSSTTLVLSLINENNAASAAGSISSLLFTTNVGVLSADADLIKECSGLVCEIDESKLNALNSGKIELTVAHPDKAGAATVRATVVAVDGEIFEGAVNLGFAGDAKTLSIAEPTTALSSVRTAVDDKTDQLTLVVSATDEAGNTVDVPHQTPKATITGPDGKEVANAAISTDWEGAAFSSNDAGATTVTLSVLADAAAPLAAGEYQLSLRTVRLTAVQDFIVAGPPAVVTLSEPEGSLALGSRMTFTATVTDANGQTVADGVPVNFAGAATGGGEGVLLTRISQTGKTKNGQASATWLVLGAGNAYITVAAGSVSSATLVDIGAAPAVSPAEAVAGTAPNSFTTYLSETPLSASELLAGLEGIDSVLVWRGGGWLRYGIAGGRLVPGSTDFTINLGSILWLGG